MTGVKDCSKTRLVASLVSLALTGIAILLLSIRGNQAANSANEEKSPDTPKGVDTTNTLPTRSEYQIAVQVEPETPK